MRFVRTSVSLSALREMPMLDPAWRPAPRTVISLIKEDGEDARKFKNVEVTKRIMPFTGSLPLFEVSFEYESNSDTAAIHFLKMKSDIWPISIELPRDEYHPMYDVPNELVQELLQETEPGAHDVSFGMEMLTMPPILQFEFTQNNNKRRRGSVYFV